MYECNVPDFVLLYQEMANLEADEAARVVFRNMTMLCLDAMGIDAVELLARAGEVSLKADGQGEVPSGIANEIKEGLRRHLDTLKTPPFLASALK